MSVTGLLGEIADIGRDPVRGGYRRPVFSTAEQDLRGWFHHAADEVGLDVETDSNGIMWAWWGAPQDGALVTGSHLDSVPGGGAFDGPLGVGSALEAIRQLRERGFRPNRSIAVVVFPEEEGSRFGVACLGSRLLTGAVDADRARTLRDEDGVTLADAASRAGLDPARLGGDPGRLARIGRFVELHVEQGIGLGSHGSAVAGCGSVIGHGRWRLTVRGQGNHAGTTLMTDRADPMAVAAEIVLAARRIAAAARDARATVGRLVPVPNGTNAIASRVDLWLDLRHPDDATTRRLLARIVEVAQRAAAAEGCTVSVAEESFSPTVRLDPALADDIARVLPSRVRLDTGAGHDAAVLAAHVPAAMLFVRNATGISHSPEEHVEDQDAAAGAAALADVLQALA